MRDCLELLAAAQPPQAARQPTQVLADLHRVAEPSTQRQRLGPFHCRLLPVIRQGRCRGQPLVQRRNAGRIASIGEAQRPLELRSCLSVRPQCHRVLGREPRVVQGLSGRPGRLGVVRHTSMIVRRSHSQPAQRHRVQSRPMAGRHRPLHRHPRQLMPEPVHGGSADERAGVQAFVEGCGACFGLHLRDRCQLGCVRRAAEDRRRGQQPPCPRRQPRHAGGHHVLDRPRYLTRRCVEHLPDVERHPAGERVQPMGVPAVLPGQSANRLQ
jgi:hypothetical protein